MPQATLIFSLPEEQTEFNEAQEAGAWKALMVDLLNHIKNEMKHGQITPEKQVAYEEIRELLWGSIHDRGLRID
jgi:hypothetical protein